MLPRAAEFDGTIALKREGYNFIANRCAALNAEAFRTRLMLSPAVCMRGIEAAEFFYSGSDLVTRRRALPPQTLRLLQDRQGAQQLDGADHRHRKALFITLCGDQEAERLAALFAAEWESAMPKWRQKGKIVLMDEVRLVLCRTACAWTGIGISETETEQRASEFGAMIDGSGAVGWRALKGMILRRRSENWARSAIERLRNEAETKSPAGQIAHFRDSHGGTLDVDIAAVELLNLLRPICATDRFIAFAAHALHRHPEYREQMTDRAFAEIFSQEVRRFYPFFPFIGGRLLAERIWRGNRLRRGTWVLLDLFGTNHDPRLWTEPGEFRPARFLPDSRGVAALVAQGAGEAAMDHRCPGERFVVDLVTCALQKLAALDARLPPQDFSIDLARFPAEPASRIVLAFD